MESIKVLVTVGTKTEDFLEKEAKGLLDLWESRKKTGVFFTYEKDNIPVGFLILEIGKKCNTIRGLYVKEAHRKQGIGEMLIRAAIGLSGETFLWVNITKGAEKLYTKLNFTVLGERRDFPDQVVAYFTGNLPDQHKIKYISQKVK